MWWLSEEVSWSYGVASWNKLIVAKSWCVEFFFQLYIYIYISGAETGLLVPGMTNNSVNVIQNGSSINFKQTYLVWSQLNYVSIQVLITK